MTNEGLQKLPVTVVIPARNDGEALRACLPPLAEFEAVWVVDSHSTDDTRAVVEAAGARFISFDWDGRYPKKRNWVLLTQYIRTEWVLFLDADEIVTEAFRDALRQCLPNAVCDGYWCRYSIQFMGRALRFGLPQRKLALFRPRAGLYSYVDGGQTDLDMEVHEHPCIAGPIGEIAPRIIHAERSSLRSFLIRHISYAEWEAHRYLSIRLEDARSGSLRHRMKYRYLASPWFAPLYFAYVYILRLGFLDGHAGFYYAVCKLWYFMTIRQFIRLRRAGAEARMP